MKVAIIGSGPAGLMAATEVATSGWHVEIFEKRPGMARKLFIAGSSGLNVSNALPIDDFLSNYSGSVSFWPSLIHDFTPTHWLEFIHNLGLETFKGTSGRYFVSTMNAALLVKSWKKRLKELGVVTHLNCECQNFQIDFNTEKIQLSIDRGIHQDSVMSPLEFDAVCFALGGGSYEPEEVPLRWPAMFREKDLEIIEFKSSNVGHQVVWPQKFLLEAEGKPIKNIVLSSSKGSKAGDLVITAYGIEGTPVYTIGEIGINYLDLKPDATLERMRERAQSLKENMSPLRRIQRTQKLCPAAEALLYHLTSVEVKADLEQLLSKIKNFPLQIVGRQSLTEAISSSGGISGTELNENLMIKRFPGVFLAGEMIDWDAPTGGFLLQGCVATGKRAGIGIRQFLGNKRSPPKC